MGQSMFLHSFQSVLPKYEIAQDEINNWIISTHLKTETLLQAQTPRENLSAILERFSVSEKKISRRFVDCPDVNQKEAFKMIYALDQKNPIGVDIEQRNLFFRDSALRVFQQVYENSPTPDHLIHVTCTGYVAPSPPQLFFQNHPTPPAITNAYHMGCYASLPAIRMGWAFAMKENERVDVLHNEICSLHLDPTTHTAEQMVVQSLFADGHIKYSISQQQEKNCFEILHIQERLLSHSHEEMTWIPGPYGMKMTLSREVPNKIKAGISDFVNELITSAGLSIDETLSTALFAIHPGGPKIIDMIQETLALKEHQIVASKEVLFLRGNMSSATLPHVWQTILNQQPSDATIVISLAFGPGLTMFGGVFAVAK
mgnify:CR=1 FL=1